MNIESASWTEIDGFIAVTLSDGEDEYTSLVPDDVGNLARRELAEWEAQGGVIETYEPPSPRDVATISKSDFAKALKSSGILSLQDSLAVMRSEWPSAFDPFLAGMDDDHIFEIMKKWNDANTVPRNDPLVIQLGQFARAAGVAGFAGLTDKQLETALDVLFGIEV